MKYNSSMNAYTDTTNLDGHEVPIYYTLDRTHDVGDIVDLYTDIDVVKAVNTTKAFAEYAMAAEYGVDIQDFRLVGISVYSSFILYMYRCSYLGMRHLFNVYYSFDEKVIEYNIS